MKLAITFYVRFYCALMFPTHIHVNVNRKAAGNGNLFTYQGKYAVFMLSQPRCNQHVALSMNEIHLIFC